MTGIAGWGKRAARAVRRFERRADRNLRRLPTKLRRAGRQLPRTARHSVRQWSRSSAAAMRRGDLRSVAFLLLLVTFALLPLQNIRVTSGLAIADLSLIAAAGVALLSRHPQPATRPMPKLLRDGLLLLAAGGVLGLVFADERVASTKLLLRLVLVIALSFAAVIRVAPSGREVRRLLVAFVVTGAASGVLSSLGDLTGAPPLDRSTFGDRAIGLTLTRFPLLDYVRGTGASRSLATNPNLFGGVSAVGAAIAVILLVEASSVRWRVVLGASVVGLTAGVLFSGSRSSLLALLVGCAPAIWRLVSRGFGRQVLTGAAVIGVLLLISLFSTVRAPSVDRLLLRTDTASSERTAESTILRYQNATRGLEHRGWSSLATGSGFRDDRPSKLHDGHLEIWVGLGIVGLVGWALICVGVIEPGLRYAGRHGPLDPRQVVLLAVAGGFAANVVVTLFVDTIWNRYIWLLVALALSLALRPDGVETTTATDDGAGADASTEPVVEAPVVMA